MAAMAEGTNTTMLDVSPVQGGTERADAQNLQLVELLGRLDGRLAKVEGVLDQLVRQQAVKAWYTTAEAAEALGKAEFTVREWCRLGRVRAEKKGSGRGKHPAWTISHDELLRIQREGLLPVQRPKNKAS